MCPAEQGSPPRSEQVTVEPEAKVEAKPVAEAAAEASAAASASPAFGSAPGSAPGASRRLGLELGEQVGRYQVRRLLGQGGMGQVYLARDVMLGRSIALKVVRLERGAVGDSERFVEEARLLAALNHPHVVQLHDAGVHRGSPYLALEYVEGETLDHRGAALSLDEALRLARAIADALTHAHAHGILHCDLKPTNLLLGSDGRLRVVDFGLARRISGATTTPQGTPEWMAPEQWQRRSLTEHVDVWALALVFLHLLGEPHPFAPLDGGWLVRLLDPGELPRIAERVDLSVALRELLARSLERDPQHRPSAREWLFALEEAISGRDATASPEGPYRGLSPFGEQHARDFFGREAEIDDFIERLRAVTFLPIVGASGVGKSSFLYAGVLPRLRARNAWTVISLRPGASPIEALARHLLAAGQLGEAPTLDLALDDVTGVSGFAGGAHEPEVRALAQELRANPAVLSVRLAALAAQAAQAAQNRSGGVLLAIDQLEELFTHGAAEADIACLLAMLRQAADDPHESIRVVATVRDDFVGRFGGLRELFVLRPLGPEALRLAITGPLRRTSCTFDDSSVIEDMLAELGDDAAAELPLLQFACRELWDERDLERRLLLRATYDRLGGVVGALARHADGVVDGMTVVEQGLARQAFLHLVVGTARRTMPRQALEAELTAQLAAPLVALVGPVIDRLVGSRLIVQRTSMEGVAVVEIIHEALLRSWGRLQHWLEETRDERRLLTEGREAADRWRRRGRRNEETWPAEEIAGARRRFTAFGLPIPELVEEFFAAGERRARARRRRAHRKLAFAALVALAVTTVSVLAAGEFRRQKLAAERQTEALRLAGSNLGRVELVLAPYDWTPGGAVAVSAAALPELSWRVFGVLPGDEHHPGAELPAQLISRLRSEPRGLTRIDLAELPGGTAFLRIDGRGRAGQRCPPSWIRVRALPGYAARQQLAMRIELRIPTCAASAADMIAIPAGLFLYGGTGRPAVKNEDCLLPELEVDLPAFDIDRTEVSNARFAPFAAMAAITGYPVPDYPRTELHARAADPQMPLASVDAFEAEAFCRYMGKRLPDDMEWVKAARGGLQLAGAPNPEPRRLYPWGTADRRECSNDAGPEDGHAWVAAVDDLPCGASPYGVLNLAGNVAEWIGRGGQRDLGGNPLRFLRGGGVEAPAFIELSTTACRNEREGRQFNFTVGMRCASDGDLK
jgi:eukaryotic-like serine/threonine-protein kinase